LASSWEGGHGGNTAHVVVIASHPDVSLVTPIGSPGVLDDPVQVVGCISTPADSEDTVIELGGRAVRIRVDSRAVELERGLRSVDGDRGGSEVDRVLEGILITRSNVGVGSEGRSRVGSRISASSVSSGVWVRAFSVNSSGGNDVVHGLSHETTVATLVSLAPRAIHEVLFGEGDELLGSEEVASFGGSSGGERPA